MIVVAILTVRRAELEAFRGYERRAASVMRAHGGAVERTIVIDGGEVESLREIHVLRFADEVSFAAYRADPRVASLAAERARSVVDTQIFVGEDGPVY